MNFNLKMAIVLYSCMKDKGINFNIAVREELKFKALKFAYKSIRNLGSINLISKVLFEH